MNTTYLQTRREFLATGIKGAALVAASGFVPNFLTRSAHAIGADKDASVLVVVQLGGGNDGLNTVVPILDDLYYKARPTIGLKPKATLKVSDSLGLHASLAPLKTEFDAGRMSIVENVGYPNPNRSHFRSMEIWHTGADADSLSASNGWLGRYFDAQCSGSDPAKNIDLAQIGVSFGKVMPQAFRNSSQVALAVDNPDTFLWNASGETNNLAKAQEAIFAKLNQPGASTMGRNIESLGGITGNEPATLEFLRHTAMNAVLSGDRIRKLLDSSKSASNYPQTGLSQQLRMIAKLIAGGFPARVYYATQGGFDTHASQAGTHARLLNEFSSSTAAFLADLRSAKQADRVQLMAFSEFGRRVAENGSEGTDHGAAGPMFLIGNVQKPGIIGKPPDLAHLVDGDVAHQIDFRAVYASVLDQWLGVKSEKVLGKKFAFPA